MKHLKLYEEFVAVVFNRKKDPEYAEKMEKVRQEVYKQLGRTDLMEGI